MGDPVMDEYVAEVVRLARQDSCDASERTIYFIKECPECGLKNYGIFWSFDTPDETWKQFKSHLMDSAVHNYDEEEANAIMNAVDIHHYVDKTPQPPSCPPPRSVYPRGRRMNLVPKPPSCPPPRMARARSLSHSGDRRRVSHRRGNSPRGSAAPSIATIEEQIGCLKDKVDTAARVMGSVPAQALMKAGQGGPPTHIDVPRSTANMLNEALVRAVQGSRDMRKALDMYEKGAKDSELFVERARTLTTQLLSD